MLSATLNSLKNHQERVILVQQLLDKLTGHSPPCDAMAMEKAEASSLPVLSPDGRPLKLNPDPGARFLSQMPLDELPIGKRVHSLNTNNRGTISGHGEHRGDATGG